MTLNRVSCRTNMRSQGVPPKPLPWLISSFLGASKTRRASPPSIRSSLVGILEHPRNDSPVF